MPIMQVTEALQALTNQLGVACGGEPGHDQTMIGDSIGRSQTMFTATNPGALARREMVVGGDALIQLQGEQQAEGARVLNSALDIALKKAGAKDAKRMQGRGGPTSRMVAFHIDDDKAEAFVVETQHITKILARTHGLKSECRKAVTFSFNTVDRIEGAYAFVKLRLPEAGQGEPHFGLHIDGVPKPLADKLQKTMGLKGKGLAGLGSAFADSPDTHSRDLKRDFSGKGKKTVEIDMSAPYVDAAFADIAQYANAAKLVGDKSGGRLLGEGS